MSNDSKNNKLDYNEIKRQNQISKNSMQIGSAVKTSNTTTNMRKTLNEGYRPKESLTALLNYAKDSKKEK